MKCIHCEKDTPYKQRSGKTCPNCKRRFAFEPHEQDPFTDTAFQRAIERVSSKGSVKWQREHLYYELLRGQKRRNNGTLWLAGLVAIPAFFFLGTGPAWLGLFLLAGSGAAVVGWRVQSRPRTVSLDKRSFEKLLVRWTDVHGAPAGLIEPRKTSLLPRPKPPDLGDYSFDRAVICDRRDTVDLLIANNFHFENNCALLSIDGYPETIFETVRTMLKRNPRLQVFALHDATVAGCRLARRIANDPEWFRGQAHVVDAGLRPLHAAAFSALVLPAHGTVVADRDITAEEAEWLSKYTLELAAIRPEQILKRLYKAISQPADPSGDAGPAAASDADRCSVDTTSFCSDAGASEGSADGFG